MDVEVMLYVYGFVCASMIVFNVVYNLLLKRSEPRLERRCRRLREKIEDDPQSPTLIKTVRGLGYKAEMR